MAGMLKNPRLWVTIGGISTVTSLYLARSAYIHSVLGLSRPNGVWRLLAIVFALLNLKSLPFGWHIRLLHGLLSHVSLLRNRPPKALGPSKLFQPVITSSRATLMDLDYNIHKSNSTYFLDLDVSRMHCMARIFALGIHRAQFGLHGGGDRPAEDGVPPDAKGPVGIHLGGVTCNFRKEIKPYEAYEIWTRVLTWDRKWIYLVSHVVRASHVKPGVYTLQPWRYGASTLQPKPSGSSNVEARESKPAGTESNGVLRLSETHPAIVATSIAKYVFKRGRWTIPTDVALRNSGLLPSSAASYKELSEAEIAAITDANGVVWDADRIESERARGMEIAEHMAGLDALMTEFSGEGAPVLGQW